MVKFLALLLPALALASSMPVAVADTVDIREWLVPWEKSTPTDAAVDARGRIWFISESGDFIANFSPQTAEFNRYDLRQGTAPAALLIDDDQQLWYASFKRRHIGFLDPASGRVTEYAMPDRKARGLRSLAFDASGDIWFTAQSGDFVGRLVRSSGAIELASIPGRKALPFGITVDAHNEAWVAASGRNTLLHVDPQTMAVTEIKIPDKDARPRRIVTTADGLVWFTDYETGMLGRYDPVNGVFAGWPMPGGRDSRPFAMAVDRNDRIWIVETGRIPNRLVAFDASAGSFLTESDIPSGAGSISHLFYHEAGGEIWFGTETNYIGRAIVH